MRVNELSVGSVPYGTLSGFLCYWLEIGSPEDEENVTVEELIEIVKKDRNDQTFDWGPMPIYILDLDNGIRVNEFVEFFEELKELNINNVIVEVSGTNTPLYVNMSQYPILRIDNEEFHKTPYFQEYIYSPEQGPLNIWEGREFSTFKNILQVKKNVVLVKNIPGEEYLKFFSEMRKNGILWNIISPMSKIFKRVIFKIEEE